MNDFPGQRRCNSAGLALVQKFEGLSLKAYRCPAGKWTIGYGHTRTTIPGLIITEAQATQLLMADLASAAEAVIKNVRVALNDNQFAALVSFVFNVGAGAFARSSLLRRLNEGDYEAVPTELLRWIHVKGTPSTGLIRRRLAEAALWRTLAENEP
jgi:lysozyme